MAFNRDITDVDISTHGVVSCPDVMKGSASQNKQRFDELVREVVKEKFNGFIDDLEATSAAGNIGFSSPDLEATNIKVAIEEVNDTATEQSELAETHALKSEGFAIGSQNGEPVSEYSPYYKNNAMYFAGVAKSSAGMFIVHKESTLRAEIYDALTASKVMVLVESTGSGLTHTDSVYKHAYTIQDMGDFKLVFLKEDGGGYQISLMNGSMAEIPTYTEVHSGIPYEELSSGVRMSLNRADSAYQKPESGIPNTDLSSGVQTSLGKADTAIQPGDFTRVASTMAAASWSGSTYSFEGTYPAASYDITVEPSSTATSEQYKAFAKAMLAGNALTNVLTAIGTVPTIDIPIIITAMAK